MSGKQSYAELESRIERLEHLLGPSASGQSGTSSRTPQSGGGDNGGVCRFCSVPEVPERRFGPDVSMERARLIRPIAKKWVNGTKLRYYFFDHGPWRGAADEEAVVRRGFDTWKDVGIGLDFEEVRTPDEAQLRIGFLKDGRSWSYVGRDVLSQGSRERTMNFGWDLTPTGGDDIDTATHEIGHSIGFEHEHQSDIAGIVWNEEAVYRELAKPPNSWPRETTFWNIIRKIPSSSVEGSNWDPDSIMHYPFEAGMIDQPEPYRAGLTPAPGLSPTDIDQVRRFYPPLGGVFPELKPMDSQRLALEVGEQRDFTIIPSASRNYRFQTFGQSDTVMVLFEETDGELEYVKGDDDSGTDLNATLDVPLAKGRRYVLRLRMYYSRSTDDTALMMW